MAERNRPDANRGQPPFSRDHTDWRRGYDETARYGPPLDTEVATGEYRPRGESLAPAGVRGHGDTEHWGTGGNDSIGFLQRSQNRRNRRTDEPVSRPPPDFGNARAWGRLGGWRHGGTGALQRQGPKGYKRSDDRIREDLCEHLMDIADIDSSDVTVHVRDGCVILDGTVPERSMRYEIEDIAATTLGVTDVENRIRVPRRPVEQGYGGAS